jgi:UDP:flavonoid glycosyltransferase YjiC (YdhE family)
MRVLLAYESGYGLGHLTRLAALARRLNVRGINTILASYRLDDVARFAGSFDRIVQAPVWPSFFASERSAVVRWGPSYADNLLNIGFGEARYIAANQLAWRGIIDDHDAKVVVADFAPGAILAAKGRCRSLQVGAPFYTPALDGEIFPAFLADQPTSGALEPRLLAAITAAMRELRRPAPLSLRDAVIGDESFPMSFPEFDSYLRYRREPLLPPDAMPLDAAPQQEARDKVYVYLPEWVQHNDVAMAALCAMNLPVRLFMPHVADDLVATLRNFRVELADTPFSVAELSTCARVFMHHGGLGSCHIGLVAGVPQVTLESDMEKLVNGRALTALGVGISLNYRRMTLPAIRDAVTLLFNDEIAQLRAQEFSIEARARLGGTDPLDTVADAILRGAGEA